MRDTLTSVNKQEEVSFWFDEYYIVVSFNELMLGYDADIYKQTLDGDLIHYTRTGGKSPKSASMSARQIILGKLQRT
tara:strand:+ start:5416 stop:5646 length:231 start_codon:yes stop_codon:yes gene_type:complete